MSESTRFASIKSFLIQAGAGVVASAVAALFTVPDQQLQLSSLALGIASIPIFLALAAGSLFLYGLYLIIHVIDLIATKLHLFDAFDAF